MTKKNRNYNPDDFPISTDQEFNSVVMENEMTGAVPVITENKQKAYGEGPDATPVPPYLSSKGKGKGTSTKK